MKNLRLMKKKEVLDLTAISNATLYRLIGKGCFPEPVSLTGSRAVAWYESEVLKWIADRPRVSLSKVVAEAV